MTAKRAPRARGNPEGSPWYGGGPEAARHTVAVKLRLPPEAAAELRAVAARDHGGDVSATVAALVRAVVVGGMTS